MSSPASTPGRKSSKRGRGSNPSTPRSEDVQSPPSQRRRTDDPSTGELLPMPTSPAADMSIPSVQDSLFSSPAPFRHSVQAASELDLSSPLTYGTPSSRVDGTPRSGVRGTPARQRPDLGSVRKARQVDLHSDQPAAEDLVTSEQSFGQKLVIWGTDVNVASCKEKFQRFLQRFIDLLSKEDENAGLDLNEPLYMQRLEEINMVGEPFLNVDCNHLRTFDQDLYRQLVCYPQEVIPTFDMAVNEIFFERYPDSILEHQIQVRPYNALKTRNMRSLNPEDIDQLITISGMIIRTSQIIPEMQEAFFKCQVCAYSTRVEIDRGRIAEPSVCKHCNTTHSMALIHNRSMFSDKQMIKLQESPEDMPAGQTPHTVVLYAHNDLVDKVQPGDRVNVTGIYRAVPMRVNPRVSNVKSVYKTHIDVIHYRKTDAKRLHGVDEDSEQKMFTEERVEVLKELARKPDIYERLASALAPSIYEHEDIKKGILLQLFGGTRKDFSHTGRGNFRAEVNILLCGDPGTSKSQLLQYVYIPHRKNTDAVRAARSQVVRAPSLPRCSSAMGLHPAVLCLLASLLLYATAAKDCTYMGKTYKDGETIEMDCEFCECSNGEAKYCERKESCNSKRRRSLNEDALKINYLDEPGVIESSFNRKKRALSPVLEDELIDNIKTGKGSVGIKGALSVNSKGSKVITDTNQVIKTVKKIEIVQSHVPDANESEEKRIQDELVKAAAQRNMNVEINIDKHGQSSGKEILDMSHVKLNSHKDGSDEDSEEHSKGHKKLGSHEDESEEHSKANKKTGSHENESEEHGKEHKMPGSHEDKSEEHGKEHKKSGSHEEESEEHSKEHKMPGPHEDQSKEHGKDHKKPGSHEDESKEHGKEHIKSGSHEDKSEEPSKEHKKSGSHEEESEEHVKEHKKPGSREDESEEHVKEHKTPGSHEEESEEHVKEHKKPGSHGDESDEHVKEHKKDGSQQDESEEHNKSDSDGGENTSENEDGCLFTHASMAEGESTKLKCLECTCKSGTVSCVRDFQCPGICSVSGYQMIRTFDGSLFDSPGICSYMLVKTSDFAIFLHNTQCEENEKAVCIEAVEVHITPQMKVKLLSDGRIVTDNGVLDLPIHTNEFITIRKSSSVFMEVVSTLGFALHYDFKGHRVYVIMDTARKDDTKGLCGTFNDNRNDDYISSNGMLESVAAMFSVSWKMEQSCSEQPRGDPDLDIMVSAKDKCDIYLDDSIFADCRTIIDVTSYKESCASSIYFGEEFGGMCSALADYAYHCGFAGITVPFRSTFPDCELNCEDPLIPATLSEFSNRDCREYTDQLLVFPAESMLNEVCVCPSDQYYDSTLDTCVDGDQCPCYANNDVYKLGEMVKFQNGKECGCQRIMECSDENIPTIVAPQCPSGEVYSDCSNGVGKSCEKSCLNLEMIDQSCPAECVPGCICPYGSYRDNEDQCVSIYECKCIHGGDKYNPGETMVQDCNTCTCKDGRFECTRNACTSVCNAYGESQFILFDKVWKKFPTADCTMILVMSVENPPFVVAATSVASKLLAGSYSTKNITIQFGDTYVLLTEFEPQVMYNPAVSHHNEVNIYRAGFYTVVDFPEGLTVYYDLHLDVVIQLQSHLQGRVEGMCGDADGTTTDEFSRGNMLQYGSQFLAADCPYERPSLPPPSGNHTVFVEERCSLLKSDVFFPCHTVVSVDSYYSACVEETASCREGESCLCFCTAVAAYARACCRKGISIDWRTADTCPAPCEYYNREAGEGPYHLTNMNQLRIVADFESGQVILSPDDDKEDLKASFMVTPGLYKDINSIRPPISLESALYPNYFIVQDEDGRVNLEKWQSSVAFRKRATFIWRKSRWSRGYDALESFTQRGYYLTTGNDNSLSVTKYIKRSTQDASFKFTTESFGLPFFSMCLWRYKSCEPPCIKTCQDPYGTKCSLSLNVEGCFPHCAEGLVFDEKTHRCVEYKNCINEPTPLPTFTPVIPSTTPDKCKDATCSLPVCKVGAIPRKTQPRTDPCCDEYICECDKCPPPQVCGLGLVAKPHHEPEEECCASYTCECDTCPATPDCRTGFHLQRSEEQNNPCCPQYECVPEPTTPPPTTVTPTKTTCDVASCYKPDCKKTGETLQSAPSDDPCCPAYTCACLPCPDSPACNLGYILHTKTDEERDCCPSHTCVCPECPDPPQCHQGSVLRQITNPNSPCCPEYDCETLTTPETITTPKPCDDCTPPSCPRSGARPEQRESQSCCPEFECVCPTCAPEMVCPLGFVAITHFDKETMCCPEYSCGQLKTTTPAIPTTTPQTPAIPTTTPRWGCEGITCPPRICYRDGEVPVPDPSDHSCCPRYSCVCHPCPPKLDCGPGIQTIIKIDIEMQCCANQTCPNEAPKPKTTPTPTTPEDECAHVTCAESHCGKTGAVPVVPADPCCDVCECLSCPAPQDCGHGSVAIPHFDSTRQCCPTFTCECPKCPPAPECEPGYTRTSHFEDENLCCPVHNCVLSPTTPRPTPPPPCDGITCTAPSCRRAGEHPEAHDSIVDCCPNVTCECGTCAPALECGLGLNPEEVFNPAIECCPRYNCVCPPTCPPPEDCKPGFILSKVETENACCEEFECVRLTTPDLCHLVTCAMPGCKKTGAIPQQVDEGSGKGSGEDPCCPEYECKCPLPCPSPPVCGPGFDTQETFDVDADCCPEYRCVPKSTVPTPTPTPYIPCKGVTCAEEPQCTKTGSHLVKLDGSGEHRCCPEYDCVCDRCSEAPVCPHRYKLKTFFYSETECCHRYECEPPCVDITCAPPPPCQKLGEVPVPQTGSGEGSGEDDCCPEYDCVCQECPPAPVCPPGWNRNEMNHLLHCCPTYTCEPPCFGVTCGEPPQCPKEGQTPVRSEGSGEDECCLYDCDCPHTCPPKDECLEGHRRIELFNPERQCCPEYICELTPCESVTCSAPPQCTKKQQKLVKKGRTGDGCCQVYICECEDCQPAPGCPTGFTRIESFNPDEECCPRYTCQPSCFGVTCALPPECPKRGETAVLQEGSGEDPCCPDYECRCESCPMPPKCDPGFQRKSKFDENIECCPTYICVPPCYGVTCAPSPQCTKIGETPVKQEGSGDDNCCPDKECQCGTCPPPPSCDQGYHRETFFNREIECCPRYTCEPPTTSEPSTTGPTPSPEVCEGVTCSEEPQCRKTGQTVVSRSGDDPCCQTHTCECTAPCGPAPDCPPRTERVESFDADTECCPNYNCVPSCIGVTCPEPECPKMGQTLVPVDALWEDECCPELVCECVEPCSPPPVCPPGLRSTAIFDEETECCPHFFCEPVCTGVTCAPPPTCQRTGEIPVEILAEGFGFGFGSGSGSGDLDCCPDYICECQECPPAPVCDVGLRMEIWIDPEVECCPHYRCVCDGWCSPPPTCDDGYRREEVSDPDNVCCPRYICVPVPTPTPETRTPPTPTEGPCQGVICSSPPQCRRVGENAVEDWGGASGKKKCCPDYNCECHQDCSPPQCPAGFTLRSFSNEEEYCCPQYTCEPPCFNVTCEGPPKCNKRGETAEEVKGSGQVDQCCAEYNCVCHDCAPAPECPAGYHLTKSFNPTTECCPHFKCESPCSGVTCAEPPNCKTGETAALQEGSGQDCCPEYECKCLPCASAPNCGSGFIAEPVTDSPEPRCCPQYNCKPIPSTPSPIPPTTTSFCAHVTCSDITCKSNERLVERPKPPQACCPVLECEPIPVTAGTTLPTTVTPSICDHVTCTVKACKPHEKLVERPTPPQACCPVYDCECQCDSVPTCGSDERLVPVHQVNQCCPRLKCEKKKDECHTVPKAVQLVQGECQATVQLQTCSGYCHSSTEYSHRWEPVPHCQCCSVKRTQSKKFEIPCPNGQKRTLLVTEAVACSCQSCSGEEDGSGEGSSSSSKEETNESSEEQRSKSSEKHPLVWKYIKKINN